MKKNKQDIRLRSWQAGNGSTMGIIIVIIVLIVGAIYVLKSREASAPTDSEAIEDDIPSDESLSSTESSLSSQSDSDEINSIETDLNANSYSNL